MSKGTSIPARSGDRSKGVEPLEGYRRIFGAGSGYFTTIEVVELPVHLPVDPRKRSRYLLESRLVHRPG